MAVEHILVIPTPVFHQVGHFQGFCSDIDRYLPVILDPQHASYRPRPEPKPGSYEALLDAGTSPTGWFRLVEE